MAAVPVVDDAKDTEPDGVTERLRAEGLLPTDQELLEPPVKRRLLKLDRDRWQACLWGACTALLPRIGSW